MKIMDLKFIKSRKWRMLGQWKHTGISESLFVPAFIDQNIESALPLSANAYVVALHRQFVAEDDFTRDITVATDCLAVNPSDVATRLKRIVTGSITRTERFSTDQINGDFLNQYFNTLRPHGRHWYEIMVADEALQVLYPTSLPSSFILAGETYTPQTLLAKAALPKTIFPMIEERQHLLQIAMLMAQNKNRRAEQELMSHVSRYSWMNSICWWEEPFTFEYYKDEAMKLTMSKPEAELLKIVESREQQHQYAEQLLSALKNKYLTAWLYVDVIRDLTDLKEANWDAVSHAGTRLRSAFKKLAAKHYLSYNQLMMMTGEEMQRLLAGKFQPDINMLNQRIKAFAVLATRGSIWIATGSVPATILTLAQGVAPTTDRLEGMTVWAGKAKGRARIMRSPEEVSTIQEGEILVCPMTDPDYMPAIRKASALVTNQGGLLCHAAIVARELQKPCVVGTEYATQIFKTGDIVEVDANKGIVKIIKKA